MRKPLITASSNKVSDFDLELIIYTKIIPYLLDK